MLEPSTREFLELQAEEHLVAVFRQCFAALTLTEEERTPVIAAYCQVMTFADEEYQKAEVRFGEIGLETNYFGGRGDALVNDLIKEITGERPFAYTKVVDPTRESYVAMQRAMWHAACDIYLRIARTTHEAVHALAHTNGTFNQHLDKVQRLIDTYNRVMSQLADLYAEKQQSRPHSAAYATQRFIEESLKDAIA